MVRSHLIAAVLMFALSGCAAAPALVGALSAAANLPEAASTTKNLLKGNCTLSTLDTCHNPKKQEKVK